MSDVRFLTEASFVIGLGVGFLSGTLVSWTLHAWTLAGMETDRPFEGGRLKAFEKETKAWEDNTRNGSRIKLTENMSRYETRENRPTGQHGKRLWLDTAKATSKHSKMSAKLRPQITPLTLNPNQERWLVWLILNETRRNANDLPREDVELKLETLARYKFGSKVRRRVRDEVIALRLGWRNSAGTVYLNRHKAREFVARARRAGVIGGR